jgi:hypothetical protein
VFEESAAENAIFALYVPGFKPAIEGATLSVAI